MSTKWTRIDDATAARIRRAKENGVGVRDLARRFGLTDRRIRQVLEGQANHAAFVGDTHPD
jgi:hypothetical protein